MLRRRRVQRREVTAVTDEQLQTVARVVANMARNELRNTGNLPNGIFASVHDGAKIFRMRRLERAIAELAGEYWLNDSRAKAAAFTVIREATKKAGVWPENDAPKPDAVAFASVVNKWEETPAMLALSAAERRAIWDDLGDPNSLTTTRDLGERGMLAARDAVAVNVQSPERVCLWTQYYDADERMFLGEPEILLLDLDEWEGSMQFWEKPARHT
jgi:hypothetical protein